MVGGISAYIPHGDSYATYLIRQEAILLHVLEKEKDDQGTR